jgi:glutamate N-acetyltransferase/amino-acid N-acetyltransferase
MIAVKGVKIATTNCGIKYKNRDDLLLIAFENEVSVAGVFTTSSMPAAPVTWCKKNIKNKLAKALVVNAGNANAFTGKHGEEVVLKTAEVTSKILSCKDSQVFISSTGVIGEILDYNLITKAIPNLVSSLSDSEESWQKAAKAIMTTDTKEKLVSKTCKIFDEKITITGFAKGSGMIAPNMATMLGYIFCDANISSDALSIILKEITEDTFNSITVDSDQSTNDTVLLFATKESKHHLIDNPFDQNLEDFKKALHEVMLSLSKMIVIDGEGAKKLIEISVLGAETKKQAKEVALAIGNSPLVKTAIAGCDPNWGRIVMAVGKSCSETSPEKLIVKIGDYQLTKDGAKHPDYVEKIVHEYLKNSFVKITVDLAIKADEESNQATIWTCDLNEEYIKINKDYRS